MDGWVSLLGSVAMIGIIAVALSLMVGAQKPNDALKNIGLILVGMVLLILLPQLVISAWHELPIWQKFSLVVSCIIAWILRPRVRQQRDRRRE